MFKTTETSTRTWSWIHQDVPVLQPESTRVTSKHFISFGSSQSQRKMVEALTRTTLTETTRLNTRLGTRATRRLPRLRSTATSEGWTEEPTLMIKAPTPKYHSAGQAHFSVNVRRHGSMKAPPTRLQWQKQTPPQSFISEH